MFHVEHWSFLTMDTFNKNYKLIFVFLAFLLATSCKKADPNPEKRDPIYSDLLSKEKEQKEIKESAKADIETETRALKLAAPRGPDKKIALKALNKAKKAYKQSEQMERYYKIRAERRRVEGRRSYTIAFQKGEHWPDPKEFKEYKKHLQMVNIDKNWQSRVPKLFKNNPNYTPPQLAEEEKAEEKTEEAKE